MSYFSLPLHAKGRSKTVEEKPHTWQWKVRLGVVERQRVRWDIP